MLDEKYLVKNLLLFCTQPKVPSLRLPATSPRNVHTHTPTHAHAPPRPPELLYDISTSLDDSTFLSGAVRFISCAFFDMAGATRLMFWLMSTLFCAFSCFFRICILGAKRESVVGEEKGWGIKDGKEREQECELDGSR